MKPINPLGAAWPSLLMPAPFGSPFFVVTDDEEVSPTSDRPSSEFVPSRADHAPQSPKNVRPTAMSGEPCENCGEWLYPGKHHECDVTLDRMTARECFEYLSRGLEGGEAAILKAVTMTRAHERRKTQR